MSQELATLYEVQQIDIEITSLKEALASLDDGSALEAEIAAVEAELAALEQRHHDTEKESLDQDLELKTLEEKRARFSAQLYGGTVRNPRQLSDLQEEVEMLSREISKIEDHMLALMDAMEQERSEIGQREGQLSEMRETLRAVKERSDLTGGRLRNEMTALEGRRRELTPQVSAQLLKRYEQIRARQNNIGLVKVTGTTCPGCRITLPSETVKSLKADSGALTCENCGRLLFWASPPIEKPAQAGKQGQAS